MDSQFSMNEREALSRFLASVIGDVDKIVNLFELRGLDASLPNSARQDLQIVLNDLKSVERLEINLRAVLPDKF